MWSSTRENSGDGHKGIVQPWIFVPKGLQDSARGFNPGDSPGKPLSLKQNLFATIS
jgi:hypothetical protein